MTDKPITPESRVASLHFEEILSKDQKKMIADLIRQGAAAAKREENERWFNFFKEDAEVMAENGHQQEVDCWLAAAVEIRNRIREQGL